ncbi:MAG: bifunctional molybdenum cofactor biosynthesis protein MoaC/MoaB [Nitrospinota bacterium]
MKDVTFKNETLRTAIAGSTVKCSPQSIQAIEKGTVPKGDPLPYAKAACFLAVKKTPTLIPHCHPLLIESVDVDFKIKGNEIKIEVIVTSSAKTGMEMEALTGASVAALTIYDILKPIDDEIEITSIKLLEKRGGKSDFKVSLPNGFKAAVIVTSDSTHKGTREDKSGKTVVETLKKFNVINIDYEILPDEKELIKQKIESYCADGANMVITTGGTGPGPRDVTVEATSEVIKREMPGISEAIKVYGQKRTPYAMFSRGLAGLNGKTLIINFPGSAKGVKEGMDAIFPAIFHVYAMMEGKGH